MNDTPSDSPLRTGVSGPYSAAPASDGTGLSAGILGETVESINEGFVLFDSDHKLVIVNSHYRNAYPDIADLFVPGARFEDILSEAAARLGVDNHGQDIQRWVADRANRHLESKNFTECELSDGKWYRISERPTPSGGIVKLLTDITRTKHNERELAHQSAVLQTTFESLAQAIAVFDHSYSLISWNDHFSQLLGYPETLTSMGTDLARFQEFDIARDVLPLTVPSRKDAETVTSQREIWLPEGRVVEVYTTPMPTGGFVAAYIDISARKQSEVALQHAQKMDAVGQLAGGVAHEFNNLLTSIGGFARMALRAPDNADRVVMCLNEVTKSADRAASLTSQLLNFSRRSAGQDFKPLRLKDLIRELTSFLRPILGERIEVLLTVSDPDITVLADPTQLHQSIVNLCINARDAMPGYGTIQIAVERRILEDGLRDRFNHLTAPDYATLSVSDTGTGIRPDIMGRIFEPFFTTKEQGKGTGLGLAMVYSTTEQMGGAVEVQSTPGKGTTFTLYLPLHHAPADTPALQSDENHLDGRGLTVLVVEDEDAVRRLAILTLEEAGFFVLSAGDGQEALEIFNQAPDSIDIVLSDVVMPRMNGTELAQNILTLRPDMKIILMSGYSETNTWKEITNHPGRAFLPKPIAPGRLTSVLGTLLPKAEEPTTK